MEFNIKQSKGHPHSWWNHWFGSIAKPAVNASGHTWDRVTAGDWKYFLKGSTRRSINQLNTPLEMFTIGQHTQLDQRISLREGVIKFRLLHRGLSETMHTVEETAIINPQNMECCCCTTQLTAEQSTMNATLKIYIVPAWIWFELPGEQDLLNRLLRHFAWAPLPTPTQDLGVVCGFWFSTSLQAFQWPPPVIPKPCGRSVTRRPVSLHLSCLNSGRWDIREGVQHLADLLWQSWIMMSYDPV